MEEFVKLTWRKNVTDEDLNSVFLSEEAVSDLYIYKSFNRPIKFQQKKNVKLHLNEKKFVAGLKYHRLIHKRSLLTKSQKSDCLVALKLIQSGKRQELLTQREKYSLQIYSECQPKIMEENRLYLEYIKNAWLRHRDVPQKIKPGILNYSWPRWKRKADRYLDYHRYYKEISTLSLNFNENDATIDFQHVVQPLETGTLARFAQPNLKEQCILKLNALQKVAKDAVLSSKLPVSRDENVPKILQNHNFDVVISSSALKQIIDFTTIKCKWLIPVIIQEVDIDRGEGNSVKKKVVFVDKVLPKVNPSPNDLKTFTYKRLLKLNFCQYEAFNYPIQETALEEEKEEEEREKRTIHHNVNYRIWNIKKTTTLNTLMKNQIKDKEIDLLVRCKLDACEDTDQGVLYPVVVRPKIERQLQYGVNIPSKSELARDWTSLFFRLYSVLYRTRIYSPMNEIVSLDKCSLQKINTEAHTHYDYKPILGLGVLQKLLSHLVDLDCGNYLLQHLPKHGSFAAVMKQCDEGGENVFDLHSECADVRVDAETKQSWLPVDVNYILPVHEEHKTIPAMFHGFDVASRNGLKLFLSFLTIILQQIMFGLNLSSKLRKCIVPFRRYSIENFLSGTSSQYIEDMYNAWLKDPKSVHVSWDSYFRNIDQGLQQPYHPPPNFAPVKDVVVPHWSPPPYAPQQAGPGPTGDKKTIQEYLGVQGIIRSYQARGHLAANLDPLGLLGSGHKVGSLPQNGSPSVEIMKHYKLDDPNKVFELPRNTCIGGSETKLPLHEIINRLEKAYCRYIGAEYMYLDNLDQRRFIRERMEVPGVLKQSPEMKKRTLRRLINTHEFENFLAKKWASEKRFGIEGCDMVIPMLQHIIDRSTEFGVEHFFMGISHRGRLNLLANVFKKPLYQIFNQFVPLEPAELGSGDVKYHYGSHTVRTNTLTSKKYKMTLLANPSHLEAVNATVLGRTRAEQVYQGDDEGKKSMAILVHGDAAFCGQGVNYESLGMSYLPHYTTHGNICVIINNQIGFTTDPRFSRSSRYCSDLGHVVSAPIFHVNSDDPESCIHVADIAAEWRAKFHRDIVIDLVGYRKHGHNEADEPMFTQPIMYNKIHKMKPTAEKYTEELLKEKVVTLEEAQKLKNDYLKYCEDAYTKASKQTQIFITDWLDTPWEGFFEGKDPLKVTPTGIPESVIVHIAEKFSSPPPENLKIVVHKGIIRILQGRQQMVKNREIDWSLGEALAIGSLLKEGIPVRLSGEDVERGTFSHRHHVIHHQTIDKVTYNPLTGLYPDQAKYIVCNSSLSEYGVLGFDVGYSQANPNALVLWEAQFGDFFNGAQCIFDQFLCGGESKWGRQNGIIVLLPHGYEGMGAEHSSGRIERFLQCCEEDPDQIPPFAADFAIKQLRDCNWIVANCSNPANLFHIWRRQILLPFRKPLMLFTPKSLLKLRECRSSFDELLEGTEFRRVIPEKGAASGEPQNVKKLIFCSGKVYYDICESRANAKLEKEIAVTTVEQLSPFPYDLVKAELEKYPGAKVVWAQEEPKNNGAWDFVRIRFEKLLGGSRPISVIARPVSAVPATGQKMQHKKEVEQLTKEFVTL